MASRLALLVTTVGLVALAPRIVAAQSSADLRTPREFSSPAPGTVLREPRFRGPVAPTNGLRAPPTARAPAAPAAPSPEFIAQLRRACGSSAAGSASPAVAYTPPVAILRNDHRSAGPVPTRDLRRREVEGLESLVESTNASDPSRADLVLRAAHLRIDLADEARTNGDEQSARSDEEAAMRALEAFTTFFTTHAHVDEALFLLGIVSADLGDMGRARRSFLELVSRYPLSSYMRAVYANFGEYFFAQSQAANALQFFDRVRAYGSNTPLGAFATFRIATIAAVQLDWQHAQTEFASVISWARIATDASALPGIEAAATAGYCEALAHAP